MVERAKEFWYTWIPGWLPICLAILGGTWWVAATVTGMQRDIQSLQDQMKDVQQYMRTEHRKGYLDAPETMYNSHQNQQQDSGGAWPGR